MANDTVSLEWSRQLVPFATTSRDVAMDAVTDAEGNLILISKSEGQGSELDFLTTKFRPNGDLAWTVRYDGPARGVDIPNSVTTDDNGNVYVTGMSIGSDSSLFDNATIKYNPEGDLDWVTVYAGPGTGNSNDSGSDIAVDQNGNVYVAGFQTVDGQRDFLTLKYSPDGAQLWAATYDGQVGGTDEATTLVVDHSGNVYVSGKSTGAPALSGPVSEFYDYLTIKYDETGNEVWAERYNLSDTHFASPARSVLCDDGAIVITGEASTHFRNLWEDEAYDHDVVTVKYTPGGSLLWTAQFDNNLDYARGLQVTPSGDVYVCAVTGHHSPYSSAGDSLVIIKYSSDGVPQWVRYEDSQASDVVLTAGLELDHEGNALVVSTYGHFEGEPSFERFFGESVATMKYDPSGDLQWVQYFPMGGDSSLCARAISLSESDGIYVVGDRGTEFQSDLMVLKYSSYSSREWVETESGSGSYTGFLVDAAFDGEGNTYVLGLGVVSDDDADVVTTKLNSSGDFEWTSRYGSQEGFYDFPTDLAIDQEGNCYVMSVTVSNREQVYAVLIKYSSAGEEEWVRTLGDEPIGSIAIDETGNVFVGNHGITKFEESGFEQWHFHATFDVVSLEPGMDGGVYATTTNQGDQDSLRRFGPQGDIQWSNSSPVNDIAIDDSGYVYTTCYYYLGLTTKFSPDGMKIWSVQKGGREIILGPGSALVGGVETLSRISLDGGGGPGDWTQWFPSQGWDMFDIAVDGSGNSYASGWSVDYGTSDYADLQTVKYNSDGNRMWLVKYEGDPDVGNRKGPMGFDHLNNIFVTGEEWSDDYGSVPIILKYSPYGAVSSTGQEDLDTRQFVLHQNYPNPFNPSTTIAFDLPREADIELKVFDVIGREVATLVKTRMKAGKHEALFDGNSLSSGIYFCRLAAEGHVMTQKLMLLK